MSADPAERLADAVLTVLAGRPLGRVAARIDIPAEDLVDAVEVYTSAGLDALKAQRTGPSWRQLTVRFADWETAEHTAAKHISPALDRLREHKAVADWWFLRKAPSWRIRARPGPLGAETARGEISAVLGSLAAVGSIAAWTETIYEPETPTFGGTAGIDIAHALFAADSHGVLQYVRCPPIESAVGRRELTVLLCTTMLRGARLDWYEMGDVWDRVAALRPLPDGTPTEPLVGTAAQIGALLASGTASLTSPGGTLEFAAEWLSAFEDTGQALRDTADGGALRRGLRAVLAHHVIFHWNRFGIPDRSQSILARAARDTVFGQIPPAAG